MRLLLISNSTNPGESYLAYAKNQIKDFLREKKQKAIFIPYAAVTLSFDEYEKKVNSVFDEIDHHIIGIHRFANPKEAIENAYSEDGVLIFGDIGSSILNSEMAMEFLDAEYDRAKIKIADAPIVEGTLIAMAINDGKTSLEEILEELKDLKNFNKV